MAAIKIGVFDSGVGGLSVAQVIQEALPKATVIFKNDSAHVPYGTKTINQIYDLCRPVFDELIQEGCQVIVVACNTVSTNLIDLLRSQLPVPLIAMEPMVKPAAEQTKSGVIAVCATPLTLASERYHLLKESFASDITVLEPDCSDWSLMIETNQVDHQKISETIDDVCTKGADVIVLGCTHYHWIETDILALAQGRARVIQPEQAVLRQLKRVLLQLP